MLVGHLPFMEKLTSYLVTGNADKTVFKFQNGGIVCLEEDVEKNCRFIKWTLMPTSTSVVSFLKCLESLRDAIECV